MIWMLVSTSWRQGTTESCTYFNVCSKKRTVKVLCDISRKYILIMRLHTTTSTKKKKKWSNTPFRLSEVGTQSTLRL
ncbi:hypothetical protein ScPMuIL_017047 [Solemya velum]